MLLQLNCIILCLLVPCFGQGPEPVEDAEIVHEDMMSAHSDHQQMVMAAMGNDEMDEDPMVMVAHESMIIRPPPLGVSNFEPPQQQQALPHSDGSRMTNKEQFCLSQMTKCLANPLQLQESSSQVQQVSVEPPLASGINTGQVTWIKKKPAKALANSIRCSAQNFNRMAECCANGPAEFFDGAILFACADVYPVNPSSVLKEYTLNLGQLPDNTLDLSRFDTTSGDVLGKGVISDEGVIDYSMVAHHFMSTATGRVWHPVLMQALRNCSQAMQKFPSRMVTPEFSYERFCFTHPYLFQQCVRKSLLLNCPQSNEWTETAECEDKRIKLERCDIFQKRQTVPRY